MMNPAHIEDPLHRRAWGANRKLRISTLRGARGLQHSPQAGARNIIDRGEIDGHLIILFGRLP